MIDDYIPLIRAIIDAFLFLEDSGDDVVDPDAAVRCMEHISSNLLTLGRSDQLALRSHLEKIAEDEGDRAYTEFVRALPDMIGLACDEETKSHS